MCEPSIRHNIKVNEDMNNDHKKLVDVSDDTFDLTAWFMKEYMDGKLATNI